MQYHPHLAAPHRAVARQRGVALFIVIVFVMLSMLLALWASRTAWFNEMIVGNDADYQRAFEAAQALLQDAELDIRGEKADGSACNAPPCRAYQSDKRQFPGDTKEINPLISSLQKQTPTLCEHGLCARRLGRQDFWNNDGATTFDPAANSALGEASLPEFKVTGARYGEYTGAAHGAESLINPLLHWIEGSPPENAKGWYWVEIMRYSDAAASLIEGASTSQLPLNLDVYMVFRITAVAEGRKPGTTVVLQETYARQRMKD
ncbi:pilus assembly PilX family protein [Comamonas jiangduensis]|uniref:pilus assembly PilX family protein n=1 Tax=Comamonas jiangduensis TaxID=1194168 RepID=UPI003BF84FE6